MMTRLPMGGLSPRPALERLIARHGARAVLLGLIAALTRPHRHKRRARPLPVSQLSPHLRRDLGLPPDAAPEMRRHWNHL